MRTHLQYDSLENEFMFFYSIKPIEIKFLLNNVYSLK